MGIIVTATSAASVFGIILGMGTKNYLVRELVASPDSTPAFLGTALVLRLLLTPVCALGVIVYVHLAGFGQPETSVIYLTMGAMAVLLLAEPLQAWFQAAERMHYLAYSDMLSKAAQTFAGIGLVMLGAGVMGLTVCSLFLAALTVTINLIWLRPHSKIDFRTSCRQLRTLIRGSTAYWAFGLFFMIYLYIDTVMLGVMAPSQVVGWYGAATRLFQTLMFIPVILSTAWLPRLIRAFERGGDALKEEARTPIQLVMVLGLPICAGTAMLAGRVLPMLYGHTYTHAGIVMALLGFAIPPMYANVMINQVLIAQKRASVWAWVMAGATVVNPIFNVFLIRAFQVRERNGAIGAALSMILTELLIAAVGLIILRKTVVTRQSTWLFVRGTAASVGMASALYAVRTEPIIVQVLTGVGSFAVFSAALRVFSLSDLRTLTGLLKKGRASSASQQPADCAPAT